MTSSSLPPADPVIVRDALRQITRSSFVPEGSLLATMLTYVVETTLDGNARTIKAYTIAVEALGRGADFDPDRDSTVRVAAMRLRQALDLYYAGPGAMDTLRIRLTPGSYRPQFETVDHAVAEAMPLAEAPSPVAGAMPADVVQTPPAPKRRFRIPAQATWLAAVTLVLAVDVAMTVSLMAVQNRGDTALIETEARLNAEDIRAAEKRTVDQIVYDIIREDIQRSFQQRVE
ncbi:hypothetical protein [Phreatobacter sp.]|uniref:hypothetical protein n=1 Tax=Phreatobacter sp. TaxID=1966341 RepID=UPI0022CAE06E|nr:hypothetical protein [Phreatobacter sp.]MCZ8313601.1 hypothetical protein [Phreatobacter sp.]